MRFPLCVMFLVQEAVTAGRPSRRGRTASGDRTGPSPVGVTREATVGLPKGDRRVTATLRSLTNIVSTHFLGNSAECLASHGLLDFFRANIRHSGDFGVDGLWAELRLCVSTGKVVVTTGHSFSAAPGRQGDGLKQALWFARFCRGGETTLRENRPGMPPHLGLQLATSFLTF